MDKLVAYLQVLFSDKVYIFLLYFVLRQLYCTDKAACKPKLNIQLNHIAELQSQNVASGM